MRPRKPKEVCQGNIIYFCFIATPYGVLGNPANAAVAAAAANSMLNPYANMLHAGQADLQHQMLASGFDLSASGYNPQLVSICIQLDGRN